MSTSPATASERPAAGAAPVVALVGRPNVGKSALFNRMVGRRQALVEELPGTTRDRLYGDVIHRDERLRLVDTGGLDLDSAREFSTVIRRQVQHAVDEAAVLLFVVDTKDGVLTADEEIAEILRRTAKPVFLLANKVDNDGRRDEVMQFYELSLGEPYAVSAQHGLGIIDVLDKVIEVLPPSPVDEVAQASRLAIVGRPNVGKSMLMNAILGEERVIVSDVPGTTRDAIDTQFEFDGRPVSLVDTAGLRRPGKVGAGLEHHASLRARHAIDRAHTALIVFDASEGLTAQDVHIVGFAIKARTGIVVVANKWDLMAGADPAEFERDVRRKLRFAPWASFRIASALEQQGIAPLVTEALRVCDERLRRVDTGPLNATIHRAVAEQEPPIVKNRRLKVFYASQPGVAPPTFVIFVNDAKLVHFSYRRYLENVIRRRFGFDGVALRLSFRSRRES